MTYRRMDADISPCGRYRYWLKRQWDMPDTLPGDSRAAESRLIVIGLNPSTADATQDDPTIRRCVGFAKRWGHNTLMMLNLFAYRATNPAELRAKTPSEIVGPVNDGVLAHYASGTVLCAWGAQVGILWRVLQVRALLKGRDLLCLGRTKAGHPRHPLYVPANAVLERYTP